MRAQTGWGPGENPQYFNMNECRQGAECEAQSQGDWPQVDLPIGKRRWMCCLGAT